MRDYKYNERVGHMYDGSQSRRLAPFDLSLVRHEMTKALRDVARIADRGASSTLIGLGAISLIATFALKVDVVGIRVASLSVAEFIAGLTVSTVLLLSGAAFRFFSTIKQNEAIQLAKEVRDIFSEPENRTGPLEDRTGPLEDRVRSSDKGPE